MNVSGLNVRITIQKNETVVDEYRNHTSSWQDYFSCWAGVSDSGKSSEETESARNIKENKRLDFTVRWSSETAQVDPKQYRILMNGRIYNITSISEMGFKKHSRKFHTELTER